MDDSIASTLEPGAISPEKRLRALQSCKQTGLLTGVNLMPLRPFINDGPAQLETMISRFADSGADYALGGGLTLFGNNHLCIKTLYYKFLQRRFPGLIPEYENLYGGFYPSRRYNRQLSENVRAICERHGSHRAFQGN